MRRGATPFMVIALVAALGLTSDAASAGSVSVEDVASTCLDLGSDDIDFGGVTDDDWDAWTGIDLDFASNEQFLATNTAGDVPVLRQRLVPSSQGSARVTVQGDLDAATTYTMSQRVLFEPGFDWGREKQGGKLGFGLGGGTSPTGGDIDPSGFSVRFMWRGNSDGTARIVIYSYASDRTQNLPYGDDHELVGFDAPIGSWFTLTMEVTANSAHGQSDGRVRAWADGDLALDLEGVLWQDAGSVPQVDRFIYATFYGGNGWEWAPNSTTFIQFGDVCWNASTHGGDLVEGDANCDGAVTDADARSQLEYIVGLRRAVDVCPLTDAAHELNASLADVSGDGDVGLLDALLIAAGP